ncbi:MAG: membrane protein insertion efficiency factor YidD, partial [Proteobacteria bacterium]|nr:membrane protein insertion efficiency factor YidD [Pseudomonadota bacterium]
MKTQKILDKGLSLPFLVMLWIYQKGISPLMPSHCMYWPSCSDYSRQAFQKHGLLWGIYLTINRLVRCQPFCQGGVDQVPEKPSLF